MHKGINLAGLCCTTKTFQPPLPLYHKELIIIHLCTCQTRDKSYFNSMYACWTIMRRAEPFLHGWTLILTSRCSQRLNLKYLSVNLSGLLTTAVTEWPFARACLTTSAHSVPRLRKLPALDKAIQLLPCFFGLEQINWPKSIDTLGSFVHDVNWGWKTWTCRNHGTGSWIALS